MRRRHTWAWRRREGVEERREEKKKKNKGDGFVVKLRILGFLIYFDLLSYLKSYKLNMILTH
jgi:hypothetical protein